MKWLRNSLALTFMSVVAPSVLAIGWAYAEDLQKIRLAFTSKSITPANIDMLIPEFLGYYKSEGLTVEGLALGSYGTALANISSKRIEFASLIPDFQLSVLARGEKLPVIDFFEATYPFKYGVAVKPGSPYKSFADLKGKKIGIPTADQTQQARSTLRVSGLDPDKDVTLFPVGEGVPAGVALLRGDIDGLFAYDSIFGSIEGAGMTINYLPLPPKLPQIGGSFIVSLPETLKEHRAWAVGVARGIAKAHIFLQENPEAASYIFLQMFPEAGPKGKSIEEQVKAVMVPVVKRLPLYSAFDKSLTKLGFMEETDWRDTATLLGIADQIPNMSAFFTNELIDEINNFDVEKVKAEARAFKLPYK